ncbi:AHH domain-containing protein [Pyxidicoccus trucidator]|uniref:AHH domain-containing protein n=1 Tax=Pyxidicoccus trucidator TaxID=2709662 RepID=UPI0013DB5480|nr:AHH domain-containing protein [Pyxidicoccus trucidator]
MPEIGELADINAEDAANDDKCPFCYKKAHAFDDKAAEPDPQVKSKPRNLRCNVVPGGAAGSHTTAQHHLISAKQCYERVRRLVRMASMVGYDINAPANGIGLPTIWNPYKGKKYADLDDKEKQRVANNVMKQTGAQWHVGHHAFEVAIPDNWHDDAEADDQEQPHLASYDTEVINQLLALLQNWLDTPPCGDEENHKGLIKDLNALSDVIKEKLQHFATPMPWYSAPYFVSDRAFRYAGTEFDEAQSSVQPKKKVKLG